MNVAQWGREQLLLACCGGTLTTSARCRHGWVLLGGRVERAGGAGQCGGCRLAAGLFASQLRPLHPPATLPPPQAVIFDEAHKLSNARTQLNVAAAKLRTRIRIGLSGCAPRRVRRPRIAYLHGCCGRIVP